MCEDIYMDILVLKWKGIWDGYLKIEYEVVFNNLSFNKTYKISWNSAVIVVAFQITTYTFHFVRLTKLISLWWGIGNYLVLKLT